MLKSRGRTCEALLGNLGGGGGSSSLLGGAIIAGEDGLTLEGVTQASYRFTGLFGRSRWSAAIPS